MASTRTGGRTAAALALGLALALAPGSASAKEMDGKFGIGGHATLGGVTGFELLYWLGKVGLDFGLGVDYFSPDQGRAQTLVQLTGGALYPLLNADPVLVSLGGRLDLGIADRMQAGTQQTATQFGVEGLIRTDLFVTQWMSVNVEFGLVLEIIPAEGRVMTPVNSPVEGGQNGWSLVHNTSLMGAGGFTFYF
jgi:hypothetical protein